MKTRFTILILLVLLGLSGTAPVQEACAQTIAAQTCDTQVWKTMEQRARLETEREIMQNQNLIYKADSILNYTCFDSFAAHAASTVGVLFTHSTYFNGQLIIPWGSANAMDTAMRNVVLASMQSYVNSNFNHTYLGGRGSQANLGAPQMNANPSQSSQYQCSVMGQVWSAAKCMNFMHKTDGNVNPDGFFPFIGLTPATGGETIQGYDSVTDSRWFPSACGGTPFQGSDWKTMYRDSRNEADFGVVDRHYQYGTPLNQVFTQVRERVNPNQCNNAQAIKTGIKVILSPGSTTQHDDGVCTNPGCSLTTSGTCG